MILGDRLGLPWFRTVFTNLGDVISPETLPPLELQSQPEDVGELLGDQISHPWWGSLLRNMADNIAPEKLPPLPLTSRPTPPMMASNYLIAPKWSDLLDTPKVFYPDQPREAHTFAGFVLAPPKPQVPQPPDPVRLRGIQELMAQKKRDLRHARIREGLWVSCVVAQVAFLFLYWLKG
jgi:hypothetical protein